MKKEGLLDKGNKMKKVFVLYNRDYVEDVFETSERAMEEKEKRERDDKTLALKLTGSEIKTHYSVKEYELK